MSTETYLQTNKIIALLSAWLETRTPAESLAWLNSKREQIRQPAGEKILFTAFSGVCRYLGKHKLELSTEELQAANELVQRLIKIILVLWLVGKDFVLVSLASSTTAPSV